ncbi:MAG TPA: cytochrome c oxidase assembly protein [Gaiellales bacterium]|jgi:putative membrane protein|nr:cytochrome c oxidase assembly protein [Gaiellales bacterium]
MLDPWQFSLDPEWAIAVAVFAVDYAVVARSYHRRGVPVQPARCALFAAGLAMIALALLSPIEHLALTSMLSFHLLQNVMIADWAPPLLILGLLTPMVLAVDRLRIVRRLAQPAVAMLLWLVAWYAIHLPVVYDYALEHRWALSVEHLVFIVTGLLFWWAEIVPGYLSPSRRVLYLFIALVMMMPLDFFIALYPRPLYSFYEHTAKLGGASALTDQRIAGAVAVLAETAVFAVALFAAAVALRRDQSR